MRAAHPRGDISFDLADGSTLRGKLHPFWESKKRLRLRPLSTTFGLRAACKPLALNPDEQRKVIILLRDPTFKQPVGFTCGVLPLKARPGVCPTFQLDFNIPPKNSLGSVPSGFALLLSHGFTSRACRQPTHTGSSHGFSWSRAFGRQVASLETKTESPGNRGGSSRDLGEVPVSNKEARAEASADPLSARSPGYFLPFGRLQIAQLRILGHLGLLL